MWCESCGGPSYSVKTTYRITKDGKEIKIEKCGKCLSRIETEFDVAPTVRISDEPKDKK